MATLAAPAERATAERAERRFFFLVGLAMSAIIVAGFMFNFAAGRSSLSLPVPYHLHGLIFVGWLVLYNAQGFAIMAGRRELHIRLGKLAYVYLPVMIAAGVMIMVVAARTHGGPFFFALNEFLVSNVSLLLCFAGLMVWALRSRRHTGWHRRLVIVAFTGLTGPGLGRLLPMPLFMPNAWTISFAATLVFPAFLMAADRIRTGRVHPAYLWGTGIYVAVFVLSMLLAHSPLGIAITEAIVAGTPGAERPMEAFLPPGFTM